MIDSVGDVMTSGEQLADLPSGSFFDQGITAKDVEANYIESFIEILDSQDLRVALIQEFYNAALKTEMPFRHLLDNGSFRIMTRKLRDSQPDTRLLVAPERVSALNLGRLVVDDADSLSLGVYPPDSFVAPVLEQLWHAEDPTVDVDLVGYIEKFKELDSMLRAIEELADILSGNSSERDAVGLGPSLDGQPNQDALDEASLETVRDVARALVSGSGDGSLGPAIGALESLSETLRDRGRSIDLFAEQVEAAAVEQLQVSGATTANWTTRAKSYMSVDVGTAVAPKLDAMFFYLGANFYLGPVNKKARLTWERRGFARRRLAFLLGVPLNPFKDNANPVESRFRGVLGDRPLLAGLGIRITDLVRLTTGYAFYKRVGSDSSTNSESIHKAGFVSISVDWDLKGTLQTIAGSPPS